MKVLLIQPPLVQLNSPYPAGAYLASFFRTMKCEVCFLDLSISLFYKIFSRPGLTRIFELTEKRALEMADRAEREGEGATAFNLRRYVSTADSWCRWIDVITAILRGQAREKEHELLFSPKAPRGSRMENFLDGLGREPSVDDVRFLASYALADLADYITAVFDSNFSLVRYAESLTVDESSFSEIEKKLDSPVMTEFYRKLLEEVLDQDDYGTDFLVGITVPFAGTFMPALYTARYIKEKYGAQAYVVMGGGFVNTELREADDMALGKYIDALSYDRGYGGFYDFIKKTESSGGGMAFDSTPIYKFRKFTKNGVIAPDWKGDEHITFIESSATRGTFPDFSDIDFSDYPRLCDDKNPMQRLWSDGSWIKAYLAHGCYWHKCAFCDTQLDYVCGYEMTDVDCLFKSLYRTACDKGVYGVHFVDEAMPPLALKSFALLNSRAVNLGGSKPLYYWGNVRFEKSFSYDLAALLSYGGLGGVSAGLEVATGDGLKNINKGTDIDSIVSACAAFKENGILVHAYMIYGFWNDTAQNIINSMETLRQFFTAGLLDSAFWHKFILTKNSRVMEEWEKGLHPELKPIFPAGKSIFARNCLHFEGEKRFSKWGAALDNALTAWMHGKKLEMPVRKWFDFDVPSPTVPKDLIEKAIDRYEERKSAPVRDIEKREIFWLGSKPVACGKVNKKGLRKYSWIYMQEEFSLELEENLAELLWKLRPETEEDLYKKFLAQIKKSPEVEKLRGSGIIIL